MTPPNTELADKQRAELEAAKVILQIEWPIKMPSLPNFLILESGEKVDVKDVTDRNLRKIGKVWTQALVEHAQNRRNK